MNLSLGYGNSASPNTPIDALALMPAGYVTPTDADSVAIALDINDYMANPSPANMPSTLGSEIDGGSGGEGS